MNLPDPPTPVLTFAVPAGTICRWCRVDDATTIVYGWQTCVACAADPKTRIRRWQASISAEYKEDR